jgi:transcriptional regulator with XRE-family HTH domain
MTDPLLPPDAQARRTFAHRLRQCRVRRVLTHEALALLSGVSATAIRNYERGRQEPHLSAVIRLAAALRVTPDALLGTATEDVDPTLHALFEELRLARPEQAAMVREFWEFLKRKDGPLSS